MTDKGFVGNKSVDSARATVVKKIMGHGQYQIQKGQLGRFTLKKMRYRSSQNVKPKE
jgi:hypothetical protein